MCWNYGLLTSNGTRRNDASLLVQGRGDREIKIGGVEICGMKQATCDMRRGECWNVMRASCWKNFKQNETLKQQLDGARKGTVLNGNFRMVSYDF